jgi:sugar O-acyltransferase (sialic acid O-acetyltransferase NeuD family)
MIMKVLGIIGSGDLGQQIAHYALTDKHYKKVVFFDDFSLLKMVNNCEVLGKTSAIQPAFQNKLFDELIIGIGYKNLKVRKELYQNYSGEIPFGKIVHSSSWIDNSAIIEEGSVIYPCCSIDAKSVIKANTILNIGCTVAHDSIIGNHSFLSPRVAIAGFVTIQERCIIGINSTIIDNVNIIQETQIGGGSVIIRSIEKSGLYVGNPAKFIR